MSIHFGYDRAGLALDAYDAVAAAYGKPVFVGRYTEEIPGTSNGLTIAEVAAIHAKGMAIAPCYNGAQPGDVRGDTSGGSANAAVAVSHLHAIGAPTGIAVYVDVEAGWLPTAAFFTGWFTGLHVAGFVPGAYLNAQDAGHTAPFLTAQGNTGIPGVIWSSEPEYTAWLNEELETWFDFSTTPLGVYGGKVTIHQYGENELGGRVDLDIATDAGLGLMWEAGTSVTTTRVAVATAGLKPKPEHSLAAICSVLHGDTLTFTGQTTPHWAQVRMTSGACKGKQGWLLRASLHTA